VPNFECAALPMLKPETDAYGVVRSGVIFDAGLVDCTPADGWTVKVAGLPSGLKWDAKIGKIVGVPTAKAGKFDGFGDEIPFVWDGGDFSVK